MTKMLEPEQVANAWALWDMQHAPTEIAPNLTQADIDAALPCDDPGQSDG